MIIDTHAHLLPQSTLDDLATRAAEFPGVALTETDGKFQLAFAGGKPTRPIMPNLRHDDPRAQWMQDNGIDLQLPGGWLDSFGYELDPGEGEAWSRFLNEGALAATKDNPALMPLATVPMQDGNRAAKVLRDAVAAGMPGAMIGTLPKGGHGNLDDPDLDPFWEAAADIGLPIIIHPMFVTGDARLLDYQMVNAVGRVTDVSIAISRLLYAGTLLRYPGLKVVASTGGGALPWMLGRLERNKTVHPDGFADPVEGFHQLYFDAIVFRPKALNFLTDLVGVDKVMMGSDYPFPIGDLTPRNLIENSGYGEADVHAMMTGNAQRLFALT